MRSSSVTPAPRTAGDEIAPAAVNAQVKVLEFDVFRLDGAHQLSLTEPHDHGLSAAARAPTRSIAHRSIVAARRRPRTPEEITEAGPLGSVLQTNTGRIQAGLISKMGDQRQRHLPEPGELVEEVEVRGEQIDWQPEVVGPMLRRRSCGDSNP